MRTNPSSQCYCFLEAISEIFSTSSPPQNTKTSQIKHNMDQFNQIYLPRKSSKIIWCCYLTLGLNRQSGLHGSCNQLLGNCYLFWLLSISCVYQDVSAWSLIMDFLLQGGCCYPQLRQLSNMLTAEKLRNLINYYYFLARKYQGCLLNWLLGHSSFFLSLSPGSPELFLLGEESPTSPWYLRCCYQCSF